MRGQRRSPTICGLAISLSMPCRRSGHPVRYRNGSSTGCCYRCCRCRSGCSRVCSWSSLCSVIAFVQTAPSPGEFSCGWILSRKPADRPRRWPGACGTLRLRSCDAPGGRFPRAVDIRHEAGWPSPLSPLPDRCLVTPEQICGVLLSWPCAQVRMILAAAPGLVMISPGEPIFGERPARYRKALIRP